MKLFAIFGIFTILVAAAIVSGETIRLDSSQGILIPAPIAHTLRVTRNAYGGGSASYAAPAPAPAAPSYSAPAPAPVAHASYIAPPCANNYVFSCQPSLSSAPCSPSSSGYGSAPAAHSAPSSSYGVPSLSYAGPAAAYSNPVPQYAMPYVKELY